MVSFCQGKLFLTAEAFNPLVGRIPKSLPFRSRFYLDITAPLCYYAIWIFQDWRRIMRNDKSVGKQPAHIWIKRTVGVLICVAFCGVIALAQKDSNDNTAGITLADLGVTEAQRTKLETLWKLKRQKQIQAVEDLKTLNRLAKDTLARRYRDSGNISGISHETQRSTAKN